MCHLYKLDPVAKPVVSRGLRLYLFKGCFYRTNQANSTNVRAFQAKLKAFVARFGPWA